MQFNPPNTFPPPARRRNSDPFNQPVSLPTVDSSLLHLAETRGRNTAQLEHLKDKIEELAEQNEDLRQQLAAITQNVNSQMAVINVYLKDISNKLDTGSGMVEAQKARNRKEFFTQIVTFATAFLTTVYSLLKVITK